METKEQEIKRLLQELKDGKDEKEVKKEFLALFKEDNWTKSSKTPLPDLSTTKETLSYEDDNPLVIFAEENGALRALLVNIRTDLSSLDEVAVSMLDEELNRLSQIQIHYRKKEEILFPYLTKLDVKGLDQVKSKDEKVLEVLKNLSQSKDPYETKKEGILSLLRQIEENIAYENHFLLPILDDHLKEEELFDIILQSEEIGYCLIRYHNQNR